MKQLWLIGFVLLLSCGKDNKSGDLQVPPPIYNPITSSNSISQTLVGHWVDAEGCLPTDRRGRHGIRSRYEVQFLPAKDKRDRYLVGKFKYGEVEYINQCVPEGRVDQKLELEQDFYLVNEDSLYTSRYENATFRYEDVVIHSPHEITFRGKRLNRLGSGPRRR